MINDLKSKFNSGPHEMIVRPNKFEGVKTDDKNTILQQTSVIDSKLESESLTA
jgi:hypothetical protein